MPADRKWFHIKNVGLGWTPATWEGWLTLLLYFAAVMFLFFHIDTGLYAAQDTLLIFIPGVAALTGVLIFMCYYKGERPRWRLNTAFICVEKWSAFVAAGSRWLRRLRSSQEKG